MKLKLFLLTGILFAGTTLTAQQENIKLENVVNEQFGTLLESLVVDGKIDEANAKTYLETVFGYDETVNNYIQALNLSQQIQNIGKGNLSSDNYVETLGSNLFGLIPIEYQQQLLKNPNYIGWQLGQEMNNGKISTETLQNAFNVLADEIKNNRQRQAVTEKLKLLTPKISQLKNSSSKKMTVIIDGNNIDNWKINPVKKIDSKASNITYNKVTIESGNVVLDPVAPYYFTDKFLNIYKNKERFDFSKDFKITIKGYLDPYQHKKIQYQSTTFSVLIGQFYKFESNIVWMKASEKQKSYSYFSVKMPSPIFTADYGVYNYENIYYLSENDNVRTVTSDLQVKSLKRANATMNQSLNLENGFELVIISKNNYLTYFINGIDTGIKKHMTYMPNKFSLDIKADYVRKTIIESLKLEHL